MYRRSHSRHKVSSLCEDALDNIRMEAKRLNRMVELNKKKTLNKNEEREFRSLIAFLRKLGYCQGFLDEYYL